ncbi:macrophage mannose receptor 1 isoform X2 [Hyalella azteca]|uniref:Macrophage mannose receptor 1 isoform X2 n=1 Tax=Hyalella azteca TaxID=294128 RepID=A0A8B7NPZ1_HYAAZ|nr:macrophage mannose receptor 1 isoform X2 [Hyalella azteca]
MWQTRLATASLLLVVAHALNCPENYDDIGSGCVLASTEWLPALEAQVLCRELHGELATLDRCDIFADAVHYLEETGGKNDSFWIGGTYSVTRDEWQWWDGSVIAMGAPFWGTAGGGNWEPYGGDCAAIFNGDNPYMGAFGCIAEFLHICEGPPTAEGHCNLPFTAVGSQCLSFDSSARQTWEASRNICQADGGDLVTFDNCEQFGVVANYILEQDLQHMTVYWVGGYLVDETNNYFWLNNSSIPMGLPYWGQYLFENLGTLLPDNPTVERCLELGYEYRHRFNDLDCLELRRPLCMASPVE